MNRCNKVFFKFIKERYIYILSYIYLALSLAIFFLGYLKYIYSIPLTILLCIALVKAIRNSPKIEIQLFKDKKKAIIIISIIAFWTILGGIGGFIWQNTWDHKFRNALFMDLVQKNWPVVCNGKLLCYYIGFWLPAALFGKIFGLIAGYAFQTFWAILGIALAFSMICQYLKNVKIKNLFIMILYSGLDVLAYIIFSDLQMNTIFTNLLRWYTYRINFKIF